MELCSPRYSETTPGLFDFNISYNTDQSGNILGGDNSSWRHRTSSDSHHRGMRRLTTPMTRCHWSHWCISSPIPEWINARWCYLYSLHLMPCQLIRVSGQRSQINDVTGGMAEWVIFRITDYLSINPKTTARSAGASQNSLIGDPVFWFYRSAMNWIHLYPL